MARRHRAVKRSVALAAITASLLLSGCALFPQNDPERPGYQEGRTTAFLYTMSKPVLPEKTKEAVEEGYSVLRIVLADGIIPLDDVVKKNIDVFYGDESPEFRAMIFNFYTMAIQRLSTEISVSAGFPVSDVAKNFMQGISDSLQDWTGEAPPEPDIPEDVVVEEPPSTTT